MAKQSRSYWGVLPGEIVQSKELTIAAKYLYVILSSMAHEKGFCWPENETLASEIQLSKRRVVELLGMLRDSGFIKIIFRQEGKTERRYIYCGMFPDRIDTVSDDAADDMPEGCEISQEGNAEDSMPPCEKSHTPVRKIRFANKEEKQSEKQSENSPLPPTGGRVRRKKSIPSLEPERFAKFWQAYPRDEERAKAVAEWDKLLQDKELLAAHNGDASALLDEISVGLGRHLACEEWQRNVGIPHAFRWLRDRRWTEKQKVPPSRSDASGSGGWAPDPEVY